MNKVLVFTEPEFNRALSHIVQYAKDGMEDGVSFLAEINDNGVYLIKKIITFDKTDRSEVSFSTDPKRIEEELKRNPNLYYVGDLHSHPFQKDPHPSGIDINQFKEAKLERRWTVIGVCTKNKVKFFDLDKNGNLVEISHRIVPEGFDGKNLLKRISELTDNEIMKKINITITGCGSLASGVIQGVACTGARKFLLADMDSFSDVNIIRHIGTINDLGRDKVDIFKEYIESKNPLANIVTIKDDLVKNRELLRYIIQWSDIVIAASGNPDLNYQINILCIEMKKPVVFGGIYERAESAYVSYYDPSDARACFDCIFGLTSETIDNNTIARKYGLEDGELKEAQGMFKDILIPGAMMASFAIELMMGRKPECNLVRYYNNLRVERFAVPKKKLCATCDYQSWLQKQQKNVEQKSLFKKIFSLEVLKKWMMKF